MRMLRHRLKSVRVCQPNQLEVDNFGVAFIRNILIDQSFGCNVDQSILARMSSKATHKEQIVSYRNFTAHLQ